MVKRQIKAITGDVDDKVYVRPDTDVGFRNTKSQGILQVTDLNAAKKLPQHDFGNPDAHVTPSAVRLVTWQEENVDDIKIFLKKKTLVKDKDQSFVMLRPKKLVGSSGSVWASNLMGYINKDDIAAASRAPKESPFREYELSWLKWLLLLHQKCELDEELMSLVDSEQEIFSAIETKTNKVITSLKELEKLIAESKTLDPVNLAKKYEAICSYRDSIFFFFYLNIFYYRHFLQEHSSSREIMSDYLQTLGYSHQDKEDYIEKKITSKQIE
ncbi:RNA-directed DNA polymerase from transposon X-element [Paramuricea clavata]|uniref:RNA-directed DNA polymerase from transposon X-element n=1 Tax=Paramuricea clavata TaxID=317549 RepID=A0A7D9HH44_PARCT|nr:RNA-directed DNA polymerase from transposon X-element [Paramuricea clavata]